MLEAVLELGRARWQLATRAFQSVVIDLQSHTVRATAAPNFAGGMSVANAVRAAARRVPWRSDCLPQAIAGYRMLVRRGLPAVIELGVQSDEAGGLRAHAWLTSYDAVLLGGNGHQNFRRLQAITTLGVAGVER